MHEDLIKYVDIMNFKPLNVWQNTCEAVKTANGDHDLNLTNKMINFALLFSVNKTMDLLDTVIFCLKKKQSHVTFLHVYHHVVMKLATSFSLFNHYTVDLNTIMAGLNSFVHVAMYTYYLLANMGPRMRRYLWWKSHLTKLQILQFLVIITLLAKLQWQGCQYTTNNIFIPLWTFTIGSIFLLFCHFYYKTYKIKTS
ncbi:very long chain fatty acid elongase 7-like isoform X2 [Rhodnius prolixus]|uniref:very long chain fatty acid elongase 7-like isoform X2 n=1 Tax=Rhodnius prolixus TaxID=13249 RepID=UPI003D18F9F5